MMTTMAALLGGVPLMLGTGTGSEIRQPLGYAMVGGLIVSQALTLFTTPVVYLYLDRLSNAFASWGRSSDGGSRRAAASEARSSRPPSDLTLHAVPAHPGGASFRSRISENSQPALPPSLAVSFASFGLGHAQQAPKARTPRPRAGAQPAPPQAEAPPANSSRCPAGSRDAPAPAAMRRWNARWSRPLFSPRPGS